ncbi:MAG: putative S-adenosylmethionine-dependent methyltransferase [Syntrophomonadaceae bacterium]|nr:putative S-adenosylmethionine-dependent methyltransferase [Bacillota bacterium]
MFEKVEKNRFGYYNLKEIPSREELQQYYAGKYYQEDKGGYQKIYSDEEIRHILNKIEQKYLLLIQHLQLAGKDKWKLLNVGCGEGWAVNYFLHKGWHVLGLDYSVYGCQRQNPDCAVYLKPGEIEENLELLGKENETFDVIWLDNVLEHVVDPFSLLEQCKRVCVPGGILIVEVPNDFSLLQQYLYTQGQINNPFWVAAPDHISYFNQEGLTKLCQEAGWHHLDSIADFPIDWNLFNSNTNYIADKSKGKSCHHARVNLENYLFSLSVEKTNNLYRCLAELGLGRQIISLFGRKQ